uniref:Uncharacterized protein n=1 Tax=Romanomermis culicivorax TaxID=13658 RepID=A0A915KBY4_ROMCU
MYLADCYIVRSYAANCVILATVTSHFRREKRDFCVQKNGVDVDDPKLENSPAWLRLTENLGPMRAFFLVGFFTGVVEDRNSSKLQLKNCTGDCTTKMHRKKINIHASTVNFDLMFHTCWNNYLKFFTGDPSNCFGSSNNKYLANFDSSNNFLALFDNEWILCDRKWTLITTTVTAIATVIVTMVKSKYLAIKGTTKLVLGIISTKSKKKTVKETRIEMHNVTFSPDELGK